MRAMNIKSDINFLCARQSTIVSEGFKGGTRGSPIMPRDAVSRTANVERYEYKKWHQLFIYARYEY